ncbi:HAMP domain-containing protein [Streptomyces sp. SID4985]|uniref:sensor histidine kinase n=1 Tax=Streptomyces sp. SID4985 TaxID=2690292 RepID=UPI00136C2C01|nr:HAMP domain-containing sensor histidine kinase [Streptomyces sp. SID4985]MYQ45338.1 HAMP domain-containing protein [Streptomyces sp. SID4985]
MSGHGRRVLSESQRPRGSRRPPRTGGRRTARPRTLRTRLVVASVALIAVVAAVIGTVTTLALREHLYDQLDGQVREVAQRAGFHPFQLPEVGDTDPGSGADTSSPAQKVRTLLTTGPTRPGTVAGFVRDGQVVSAARTVQHNDYLNRFQMRATALTADQVTALSAVPRDNSPHTVHLPGRGDYLVRFTTANHGADQFYVALPTADADGTVDTLVLAEVCVTLAGLVAASLAGAVIVGVATRPLRRVAATATRVSELPLHSGEVNLSERVPEAECDPHTEVGRVGAALNRMLDHVHGALHARQQSETRVRRFVADASHELRTPLASIRGYAELTRRGREPVGPDTRHALGRIESEAARMTLLVEDLLLLARLDAGRPLQFEQADLVPLVVDTVSDARAAGLGHNWRLDLPDEPALVTADVARLHQVLVNLLGNARTHTPPGSTVTARVRPRGPWMCVDIEDDGPGIPTELLPHVFERFARGDSARTRATGSTGLGLAIVRAVVLAHGGDVRVESAPGRTVFTVRLPLTPGKPLPSGRPEQSLLTQGQPEHRPHSQPDHSVTTPARQGA